MQEHLYTTADVKRVREALLAEQKNKDKATGLEIPEKQAVLDHCHKTQRVRGVLHRQSNAMLGKLENNFVRYMSYWYPGTLSEFLREMSNYLDAEVDERFIHPGWIKKANTEFNKLTEKNKDRLLESMQQPVGKNSSERKEIFRLALLTKEYRFDTIMNLIKDVRKYNPT